MTVYAIGSTNDDLVRKLRGPDPRERASAAEELGFLHDYLALPHLLTAARGDSDDAVREAARLAVRAGTRHAEVEDDLADLGAGHLDPLEVARSGA